MQRVSSLCCCFGRSRSKRNTISHFHPAIDIYTDLNADPPSSRLATLSLDYGLENNLISRTLVRDVLNMEVQLLDKEGGSIVESSVVTVDGQQVPLQGYVDIQWSINNAPRKIYSTRFYVPEVDNPSFDAKLAQQTIQEYGLLKSRSRRHR